MWMPLRPVQVALGTQLLVLAHGLAERQRGPAGGSGVSACPTSALPAAGARPAGGGVVPTAGALSGAYSLSPTVV
jgi:hypothetical protein